MICLPWTKNLLFCNLVGFQICEFICFVAFAIIIKISIWCFCIKFNTLYIEHHHKCNESKHTHVCNTRVFSLHLFWDVMGGKTFICKSYFSLLPSKMICWAFEHETHPSSFLLWYDLQTLSLYFLSAHMGGCLPVNAIFI